MIAIDIIRSMQRPDLHQIASRHPKRRQKELVPGPFDVICARGKQAYNHQGVSELKNQIYTKNSTDSIVSIARGLSLTQIFSSQPQNRFFRQIIQDATEKYSKVESKLQRSMIVTDIVDAIRVKGNGFLRKNSKGEWEECSDVMCREKVGQHFRNALGSRYKSSTKSKRRIKEESIPRLMNRLHKIIFSSKAVSEIIERLELDIIFIDESNEDEFYQKAFEANMNLLNTFKQDTTLVHQFRYQFSLGQQETPSPPRNSPTSYSNAAA